MTTPDFILPFPVPALLFALSSVPLPVLTVLGSLGPVSFPGVTILLAPATVVLSVFPFLFGHKRASDPVGVSVKA